MIDYAVLNNYIGRPWVYRANDCWAVFRKAARELFEIDVYEIALPADSNIRANINLFETHSANVKKWRKIETPTAGAAVLFYNKRNRPIHIGLYIESGNILHCEGSKKRPGSTKFEHLSDLQKRFTKIEFFEYADS